VNHKKVKKLKEEYIRKQNMKPRDLVSTQEMSMSPQKVHQLHKEQQAVAEVKQVLTKQAIQPRLLRDEQIIIQNIRAISPGAPSYIF